MNWMAKQRGMATAVAAVPSKPGPAVASSPTSQASTGRTSNGLKEFLWLLSDVKRGRILDLCPATQSTLNFFIEKGYRISAEDMLRTWKHFLNEEEERMRAAVPEGEPVDRISKAELGAKFLESNLNYPPESFHGILAWDFCDYFDPEVLPQVMQRIYDILHPGGAVLAMFHSRPTERFHNYRVVDGQTIEPVVAPTVAVHTRVFQNREILDLFDKFRSSKTFVGRDQVREALFLK